ncbi:MAG: response regulator transcription factor [Ardenticatenaceae bacterium]|nr:response regulator transcription factor [Ardenticatenaceae bacterium]
MPTKTKSSPIKSSKRRQPTLYSILALLGRSITEMDGRSEKSNRILIVSEQGIMGSGLEKLLVDEQTFEVVRLVLHSEEDLLQQIWQLLPDIIILALEPTEICPARLLEQLQDYGRVRIVLVDLLSNEIDVYDREPVTLNDYGTLINHLRYK